MPRFVGIGPDLPRVTRPSGECRTVSAVCLPCQKGFLHGKAHWYEKRMSGGLFSQGLTERTASGTLEGQVPRRVLFETFGVLGWEFPSCHTKFSLRG